MYIVSPFYDDCLAHYGVKGMKWGVHRTPEQLGRVKRAGLSVLNKMADISYDDTPANKWRLKSSDDVKRTKSGNCHDQVIFEAAQLRKYGVQPKIKFLIEHDDSGQGGVTHSFVYFNQGKKTVWMEHAWEDKQGLHEMADINQIKRSIQKSHSKGEFGNKTSFPNISWGDLDDKSLKEGMTLQEIIDQVKWED